jgi:hypothetical protein
MSRTDKTRPWNVQKADPHEKRWYRVCDRQGVTWYPWYRTCHCRSYYCCSTEPNRHERRRDRHQAQRMTREAREARKGAWE